MGNYEYSNHRTRPGFTSSYDDEHGEDAVSEREGGGRRAHPSRGCPRPLFDIAVLNQDYEGKPTEEERLTLRRVPGKVPGIAYLLCAVEFCERASYYGCVQIWTNYINRPLPKGGNGLGAVPAGSQATQGALGLGEQIAVCATFAPFMGFFPSPPPGVFHLTARTVDLLNVERSI
ncbi:general substrate transporter [Apiospora arundinis]